MSPSPKNTGEITVAARMRSKPFDTAEYLQTPEQAAEYLNAALEDGDEHLLLAAVLDVVKASGGVTALSRKTDISREAIYRALSKDGNPRLSSLIAILHALDLDVSIVRRRDHNAA